mgnify:CR=1 FL=1
MGSQSLLRASEIRTVVGKRPGTSQRVSRAGQVDQLRTLANRSLAESFSQVDHSSLLLLR